MSVRSPHRARHQRHHPAPRAPVRAARGRDVVLRDGRAVHLRPIRAEDEPAVRAFLAGLDQETLALRYFTAAPDLKTAARAACRVDPRRDFGVVAVADGQVVAHGCLVRTGAGRAEVGFVVSGALQGSGLGTALFDEVVAAARSLGIGVLTAVVRCGNRRMLGVFRHGGRPVVVRAAGPELRVEIPLARPGRRTRVHGYGCQVRDRHGRGHGVPLAPRG